MLILIDFYAENPIVGKTLQSCYLENSNVYDDINGNGNNDWGIFNSNNIYLNSGNSLHITGDDSVQIFQNTVGGKISLLAQNEINLGANKDIKLYAGDNFDLTAIKLAWLIFKDKLYLQVTDTTAFEFKKDVDINYGNFGALPNNVNIRIGGGTSAVSTTVIFQNVSCVKIPGGTNGQVMTTDGAGNLSWTTPSSGGLTTSNFVFNEIPVGLINNVNLNYTLAFIPQANTVQVFVNGLLQKPTTDYTVSGSTLSFVAPLQTGDELLVHYIK